MNKSYNRGLIFFFIFLLIGNISSQAQTDKELLAELIAEEQDAVNALVMYPKDTRTAILTATLHPEALIKMESIQTQTRSSFKELMDGYPQKTQQMIWDLTRYPGLINKMGTTENSDRALDIVLADYPEIIHKRARQASRDYYPLLVEIDRLNQAAESAFQTVLYNYAPKDQDALRQLTALPEVLTILTENIRLTILVGDLYKQEPRWLTHKADSLNLVVARENAKELEDWKKTLEENPDAIKELQASGKSYIEENTYDDDEYYYDDQAYLDDLYADRQTSDEPEKVIIHHHYDYHYPYWFGYPYWYEYPRWRAYPRSYDWGFYFNPNRTIIVIGLPSFSFTSWYFHHPHHHTYWPHLSSHFVHHYYGHRYTNSSITTSVTVWRSRNQTIITDNWLQNDGRLPNRFKEYGKFETERIRHNRKNPKKVVSQKEYVVQNKRKYPTLSKSVKTYEKEKTIRKETRKNYPVKPNVEKPKTKKPITKKPAVKKPKRDKPVVAKPKTKKPSVKKPSIKKPAVKKPTIRTKPKVNKAKDYHKNTWEKSKAKKPTIRKPSTPRTVPKTKRKTTKKVKPTKRKN